MPSIFRLHQPCIMPTKPRPSNCDATNHPMLCSVQVQWPDSSIKTCLVPFASLLSHSDRPHVIHYSKLDPGTRCLKMTAFRPCSKDMQCYLSYGPLSNLHLMLFYGFTLRDNAHDVVELTLQVRAPVIRSQALLSCLSVVCQARSGPCTL